jgi:hypothetical protein
MRMARFDQKVRAARHSRIYRRRRLLQQAFTLIVPEAFSPEESFQLVFGSSLDARRAFNRASRRQEVRPLAKEALAQPGANLRDLTFLLRPTRVLSRLNRSAVFPPLVLNDYQIDEVSISRILAALRRDCETYPPHRLLDAFATASGLSWEDCADLLLSYRLIPVPIGPEDINATRRARLFWNLYEEGRARYAALVAQQLIPPLAGDWASSEKSELERLLPGILIPGRFKRDEYLMNWIGDAISFSLDVHVGSNGAPLFQHRFFDNFNPLVFGRPRP